MIVSGLDAGRAPPSADDVAAELDNVSAVLRIEVTNCYGSQIQARDRRLVFATARQQAEQIVEAAYESQLGRWTIVPGKALLSAASAWSQQEFGVSFGAERVARELRRDEIDAEIAGVIQAIGAETSLP